MLSWVSPFNHDSHILSIDRLRPRLGYAVDSVTSRLKRNTASNNPVDAAARAVAAGRCDRI